ncbi:hypothetical protein BGZ76_009619 [Entomortierella beljakovae]|nr:hypothetical protein BGZ76_009619 [Entomortierella beljakovae]
MTLSTYSSTAKVFLALILLVIGLASTFAAPIDPLQTLSLSFLTQHGDPVPNTDANLSLSGNNCLKIPSLSYSFKSNLDTAVFALYEDDDCQSYLFSVESFLENVHDSKSLMWVGIAESEIYIPGNTFTDPVLSGEPVVDTKRARLIQIAMISVGVALFFITLGLYLCYLDNRKNMKRGFVPEPSSPTGHRNMAEVSGPGRSIYQYNSHHRNTSSTASSVTYLPPYASDGYEKSGVMQYDSVAQPEEVRIANSPSEKKSSRYELPNSRSRSFSNLTNQVGTGAGLEPGSVQQGRNEGFGYGLGYDLEDSWKMDSRRNSGIILRDAVQTSPHSPKMRPSSVISDDYGQIVGRGGVLIDSRDIYMPA